MVMPYGDSLDKISLKSLYVKCLQIFLVSLYTGTGMWEVQWPHS